jgi:amino acid adenylation domain-containing protein
VLREEKKKETTSVMDRFTQFPAVNEDGDDVHIVPWQVDVQLPSEVFALSWAILLRAFTTEESPVFLLNGAPVKADISARTVQPADLAAVSDLSVKHTAVVLGDALFSDDRHPPALRWALDPATRSGALRATGGMNAAFLFQIGNQLKQIVQEQAAQEGIQVTLSATEIPDLAISNGPPSTLPGPQLLHKLALRGLNGANHAIEFLGSDGTIHCLSYQDLDRLSSKLASSIARASTTPDGVQKVVPVLLPQSLELYISWLAILKAGAAFCPLNTDAPTDRIEFILQDVAASVVVTSDALAARISPKEHITIFRVDEIQTSTDITEPCSTRCTSTDLAYVMYTSGSTGRPKGVGVSHLAATQSLLAHDDLISPFKRFLQFASPTFDVSVFEVFFPLMRGATLIGSEREHMLLDISHVMTTMRVDAAELTPTVAGELLRTRAAAPSLQVLLTIGEMLTRHVVDEFGQSESRDGILHGMYGPTEAAIHCTAATKFQAKDRVNMIGKPFKTVSAYIMSLPIGHDSPSKELHVLSLGQIGELVVGGPQLADGYINRPEENAKAFIDSPLYGRLYRTGDKARMLPTGEIECFGRIASGQVKLRGQRIELGEIEHVITRASGVRSAVTIVIDGNLVAFVLVTDKGITDSSLRDVCRQLLPRFMIPGEFVLVDQFPQLPSGKIDRKTLEADFVRHRSTTSSFDDQPGRDEKEDYIVSCVAGVLGRRLSPAESLTAAGLDSLAAIRLASHLLDAGIRIGVAALLEADSVDAIWQLASLEAASPTKDSQAALQTILQLVSDAGAARVNSLGLGEQVSGIVPSSHIQQAMVLETIRDNKAYCNWIELEFEPSVSLDLAQSAFRQLVNFNEILRSGFVEIGLKDHSYCCFTWNTIDEHICVRQKLDYNVSLSAGHDILNPFRVQIVQEEGHIRVLVHMHHAIYDGWSWQLMMKDLRNILSAEELASKSSYNLVTNAFIQNRLDKSATESCSYWREQLQGLKPAVFPTFHGDSDIVSDTEKATRMLKMSVPKLNEVSQRLRVSRQTIFQAAFCYILSSYLGTGDVTFGTVFSGRTLPLKGIETVLGPCIRTLPIRMNLDEMQDVTDLLLAIQNMNRRSLEHGSVPLQDIKRASGIDLDCSLFDTAIVWQESIWSDENQASVFREVAAGEFLEFALLLEFEPSEKGIFARATYQKSILPYEQAMILLEQIDTVASILIDKVKLPIEEIRSYLPLSTLSIHNAAAKTDLQSLALGVEEIASTDPSRVAVELMLWQRETTASIIQSMTYAQLNSRANGLAHLLLHIGVTKTDLIAIRLPMSLDLYVAILGVVKAGAGLLLLPSAPPKIIHCILSAAKSEFCIVDPLLAKADGWDSLKSVHQIHLSDSLDVYHEFNIPYSNEGADIAYAEVTLLDDISTENIVISHQSLQSNINALSDMYPTPPGSKLLICPPESSGQFITTYSMGFLSDITTASICETFFAWHTGLTLCSAADVILRTRIEKVCQDMDITHLHLPPRLASRIDPQATPRVQRFLSSGEEMNPKLHRKWAGKGLYQAYSSHALTHACTICCNMQKSTHVRNIGRPLKSTSAMIMADGDSLGLLPRGAIGELCFGGDQVGRCISDSDSLVTGRFVNHPDHGRIYKTGDFGRLLPDGTLILSRGPTQSHACSIDLDEIDRVLTSLKMVREFVSIILEEPTLGQQQLAVFWVPSANRSDSLQIEQATNDLFNELTKEIPSSRLPSLLVLVDEIELTMSYKTNYPVLRRKVEQLSARELAMFSPKLNTENTDVSFTELEKTIAIVLSTVTGTQHSNIRKHTSFYRLGLDSLSAISLSRTLQESGCGRLAVSTILQHSSIAQLAAVISAAPNGHQTAQAEAPVPTMMFGDSFTRQVEDEFEAAGSTVQNIYPCTPLQEAMLAAESDGRAAYFNHLLLLVRTDPEPMRAAWANMMQRHDILRTCFTQTNHKRFAYAQVVLETSILPWSSVETSSSELENFIKEIKTKFEKLSPVNGQLPYSLTLINDSTLQETHLLLSIHHALYDGDAIGQLLQELQLLLSGEELPEIIPFRNFITYMTTAKDDSSDEYWDRYLSGVSPTLLHIPKPTANTDGSASLQVQTSLDVSFKSFKQQCKDLSVAPLNIFHAAWARLLSLYTESSDICFGNVFSCRTIPLDGVDRTVGPCFNTLPIRINSPSTATNSDLMKLAQKINSDILPHQLSPLRRIQRRVLGNGSRLFDTLVIFQNRKTDLDRDIWEIVQDEGNMGFPLICEIVPDDATDSIQICLQFQVLNLSRAVAERIARDFVALVKHIVQYPSAQASDKRVLGTDIPCVFDQKGSQRTAAVKSPTKSYQKRPWSHQEQIVHDILCEFSDIDSDKMSHETTIFQLGLDSINAVQVSAKLRGLGYKIPSGDILEVTHLPES